MLSLLPDFADPLRLCALEKAYEGAIPLADLTRLAPLLTSSEGEAAFALAFRMDPDRGPVVRVEVRAKLSVQCQRCLDAMPLTVASSFSTRMTATPSLPRRWARVRPAGPAPQISTEVVTVFIACHSIPAGIRPRLALDFDQV